MDITMIVLRSKNYALQVVSVNVYHRKRGGGGEGVEDFFLFTHGMNNN